MKCEICGTEYELRNKHGGQPKVRNTCGSNSCQAKWQYKLKANWYRQRGRKQYWLEKKNNYEKLRKRNSNAKARQRFGVTREELLKKFGNKCSNCNSKKFLVIHHIDHQGRNVKIPNNNPKNLTVVCKSCHNSHHRWGHKLKT